MVPPETTVDRLDIHVFVVPLEAAQSDGTFTWSATTVVAVESWVGDQAGLGFSYATAASAQLIADVLRPVVVGADPFDVPMIWRNMVAAIRNVGRPGVASMAIAAVDIAMWDLKAKLLGLPLCDLLGRSHDRVAVYGSGGFTSLTDDELAGQLGGWVHDQGIPRVKMKIGTAWGSEDEKDAARIGLAREIIGKDAELYVDANGAYTAKQAIRLAERVSGQRVSWFEEPVSSDDLAGLAEVRSGVSADVAAGEYGYDLVYFERMCAAGAVDVIQADVSRCAGITEWLRAAAVAAAHGLEISGHCAQSLHIHPACSVTNIRHLEYFADHARLDRLLFDGVLDPGGGYLEPDRTRPGIGLELRHSDVERYRHPGSWERS